MAQSVKEKGVRVEGCQMFSEVEILGREGFQAASNRTTETYAEAQRGLI